MADNYQGSESRRDSFGTGLSESPGVADSPGLMEDAQRFANATPQNYKPTGSASGMSQTQYEQTQGGMVANQNGSSQSSYSVKKWFKSGGGL